MNKAVVIVGTTLLMTDGSDTGDGAFWCSWKCGFEQDAVHGRVEATTGERLMLEAMAAVLNELPANVRRVSLHGVEQMFDRFNRLKVSQAHDELRQSVSRLLGQWAVEVSRDARDKRVQHAVGIARQLREPSQVDELAR